ncbi:smad nuclear interacting protein 1-like isoform X2 [Corticium candelabrum]|uniref:smad nuclear interacting protein 1-like isoform X2 n=1 Tax=Corticium candelabrum TaxID=121492 RepID=UPI002E274608|nr:smad nuclear interacting protein 1-like isoform X2 [Corticium candelabrum]
MDFHERESRKDDRSRTRKRSPSSSPRRPTESHKSKQSQKVRDEGRSSEGRSNEGRSNEGRSNEGRSNEGRSSEGRSNEGRSNEGRSSEGRSNEGRSSEGRSNEGRSNEGRSSEGRSNEGRSNEGRSNEWKRGDKRRSRSRSREREGSRRETKDRKRGRRERTRSRSRDREKREEKEEEQKFRTKDDDTDDEPPENMDKPDYGLSGKLTADTNTYRGVVIKYNEPPEARVPKRRWRLYPFKGDQSLDVLYIHRQSAYLVGRERKIADIPLLHPSISKQHAVLQYRLVNHEREDGVVVKRVKPYVIDLESTNGTFVNNNRIEASRYTELMEKYKRIHSSTRTFTRERRGRRTRRCHIMDKH